MNIYCALKQTGLYSLKPGGVVHSEAAAYEAALGAFEKLLLEFQESMFPQTASRAALERFFRNRGLPVPPEFSLAALREAALALLSMRRGTLKTQEVTDALGARLTFTEDLEKQQLLVQGEPDGMLADTQVLETFLKNILPVGVQPVIDTGTLTWTAFDGGGLSASELDAQDFSWTWFDTKGQELFPDT